MPKNKTHSGAKKRFRRTGSGTLRHESANRQHLFEKKSSTRTRRIEGTFDVAKADTSRVRRMLGI